MRGPVAVGAPGNIRGWAEMVANYGTRAATECLRRAIGIATADD